jgi:hypothetical protein
MVKQQKKISIRIKQKNNIISSRNINKSSKTFYKYSRKYKAYIKKSKIEISKIKFIISSKQKEKIVSKRVKKIVGKRKEKLIKEKIKEVPEIEKEKTISHKEHKHDEILETPENGYYINTYLFSCKVSDRKIEHDFSIRDEIDNKILEMHENKYPNHEVINYGSTGQRFISYGKGKAFNGDYRTEKQKEFLKVLGVPDEVIGTIKNKSEASKWISKYSAKNKNKKR